MRQVPSAKLENEKYVLLIGSGRLVRHITFYFSQLNIPIKHWARKFNSQTELEPLANNSFRTLILIKDDAIEPFVEENLFLKQSKTFHCSGALTIPGINCIHPLMTFTEDLYNPDFYSEIPWAYFEKNFNLKKFHDQLTNPSFYVEPQKKSLYHSLCVCSGNLVQLLWLEVFKLWSTNLELPFDVLKPYLQKNSDNFLNIPNPNLNNVTGPIVRKDFKTISKNLDSLEDTSLKEIYIAILKTQLNNLELGQIKNENHF